MKKQFKACLLTLFSATAIINSSFAQTTAMYQPVVAITKNADYTITSSEKAPATNAIPVNEVSPKALRSFDKSFKDITNPQWYALDKKSFLATFTNTDGRSSRVLFGKNGYMYYTIHYGNEKSLPKEERRLIKSNYVDYTIGRVSEVRVEGQKAWIANLQDDNDLVVVRLTNGVIDELAHYQTHLKERKHKKSKVIIPE